MSEAFPANLRYTKDHEWAATDGDIATIGITQHAQDALGEVVFVDLPEVGQELKKGDSFGAVESIKAVSDLYAPVSGKITAVNSALADEPALVNSSPYDDAWMVKIELSDKSELEELMQVADYKSLVESL